MQRRGSDFNGFTIEATDGFAGRITDLLFEDDTWAVRWFVVLTDSWTSGQQLLIHPAALERPDIVARTFAVRQTRAELETNPRLQSDEPVSRQMEQEFNNDYANGPTWGGSYYGGQGVGLAGDSWQTSNGMVTHRTMADGDPHLRSLSELQGYHIHALDGKIGHLTDFLIDDGSWKIDCVLIDTKNWWLGKHVLLPAAAIAEINWGGRYIRVSQTCYNIKASLPWTESDWSKDMNA